MQYQLHDYEVDSITFEDNKIIFLFPTVSMLQTTTDRK